MRARRDRTVAGVVSLPLHNRGYADRYMCETYVSRLMGIESEEPQGDGTTKIDVRVPTHLVEQIDAEYERRGYTSRSEAIRDALRAWVDPPIRLSEEILDDLEKSREQREAGETVPADEVRDRLGLND